jgi:hypothetical protein
MPPHCARPTPGRQQAERQQAGCRPAGARRGGPGSAASWPPRLAARTGSPRTVPDAGTTRSPPRRSRPGTMPAARLCRRRHGRRIPGRPGPRPCGRQPGRSPPARPPGIPSWIRLDVASAGAGRGGTCGTGAGPAARTRPARPPRRGPVSLGVTASACLSRTPAAAAPPGPATRQPWDAPPAGPQRTPATPRRTPATPRRIPATPRATKVPRAPKTFSRARTISRRSSGRTGGPGPIPRGLGPPPTARGGQVGWSPAWSPGRPNETGRRWRRRPRLPA